MAIKVITFTGEARSGKGTSASEVEKECKKQGRNVLVIDQGQKFRVLARLAVGRSIDLEDTDRVTEFLQQDSTTSHMLDMLDEVARSNQDEINTMLYTSLIGRASAQIGKSPASHETAVRLLFEQVGQASRDDKDTVLIDGRSIEKYGHDMAKKGLAQHSLGFYFKCDSAIAARRSNGMFVDMNHMSQEQLLTLMREITRISDRNKSDAIRDTDPLVDPSHAYHLDLKSFKSDDHNFVREETIAALNAKIVTVNTSYTESVDEMTRPVVAIANAALAMQDATQ